MIVDTSVWIEFLRASGSDAHRTLVGHITDGARLVVPEVVLGELLVGTTDESTAARYRSMVGGFELTPIEPLVDIEDAARIYRSCRRRGETVRNLIDCIVAATARRLDLPVLHRDRDFEVMARHVDLRTVPLLD